MLSPILSRDSRMSTEIASVADFRPHSSHWGVFSAALARRRAGGPPASGRPRPERASSRTSPPRCATPRASRSRWCAAAGWSAARARTAGAAATSSCPCPGTRRSTCSAPSCARVRDRHGPRRDLRRLLRLGQRRALPPRAEPDPPLPEHRARRLRRARSTATAPAPPSVILPHVIGPLRGADAAQRHLGPGGASTASWSSPSAAWR